MFRSENYVMLYINEYIGYIFDNLEGFENVSNRKKEELKKSLLFELKKLVNVIGNFFELDIDKQSVATMKKNTDDIEKYDPNHKIPFYEIALKNCHIQLIGGIDCLTFSFHVDDIIVNCFFYIENYLKNKNFNKELEAYTQNEHFYYIVLDDGKLWVYNKNTTLKKMLTNLNIKEILYPDDVFIVGSRQELGFMQLIRDIRQLELSKAKSYQKR